MTLPAVSLQDIFSPFEKGAKDPSIGLPDLTHGLASFLNATNYKRTAYTLHLDGVYRARKGSFNSLDDACKEFGHVNKLRYPPEDFAAECRCNEEKCPVFYCTTDYGVPVFEVRPEINDFVVIATFRPKNRSTLDITVPIIGVKQLVDSIGSKDPDDQLVNILQKDMHYKSEDPQSLSIDSFIAEWFVQPVNEDNKYIYRMTTAFYSTFTTYIKYGDEKIVSLIYPSVESDISGFNLVMQPSLYDEQLEVEFATIYQLERKVGKTHYLRPKMEIDTIYEDGKIDWRTVRSPRSMYILDPSDPSPKVNRIR